MTKEIFLIIDNNIYAILLLGIIAYTTFKNVSKKSKVSKYLKISSILIIIQLIFETVTYLLQITNKKLIFRDNIVYINTFIISITAIWIPYAITMFTMYYTNYINNEKIKKIVMISPVIIGTILLFYNIINPIVFTVENGKVIHGSGYFIFFIVNFVPFLNTILIVTLNRKKIVGKELNSLVIFLSAIFLGIILRAITNVKFTIYPSMALALSIEMIFLKKTLSQYDDISKFLTREKGEEILSETIKNGQDLTVVYINSNAMLDLYQNKNSNEITKAIKNTSNLINDCCSDDSIKVKYDINKILIIYYDTPLEKIESEISKINNNLLEKNIKVDIIIRKYNPEEKLTKGQFLRKIEADAFKKINATEGGNL